MSAEQSEKPKGKLNRQPSIKKVGVKHTATSYLRILKANPLLKYELEGKPLPVDLTADKKVNPDEIFKHSGPVTGKQSLTCSSLKKPKPPNVSQNCSKTVDKSSSRNVDNKHQSKTSDKNVPKNIDNNGPKVGRYPNYLKSSSKITAAKPVKTENFKVPNSTVPTKPTNNTNKTTDKRPKLKRRSLSAQHIDRKKGKQNICPSDCIQTHNLTQSMEDLASHPSTIAEEKSMIFKTPSAYERRSIVFKTPISTNKRCLFSDRNSTPRLPTHAELQKRLNDWLTKHGKSVSNYSRLKTITVSSKISEQKEAEEFDEENKENIEGNGIYEKGSYEDLKLQDTNKPEDNEKIAKQALEDLQELILDGYDRDQCEHWLYLIRQKYRNLDSDPQFWECRAAIEQTRRNIGQAIEYYQNAIINGAEVKSVDKSLDQLLEKFSILNLDCENTKDERINRERVRMVQDARNVFKSSIIQFAVQERKLKSKNSMTETKEFIATPVRRSTRLSRSTYRSTPGVQLCTSLKELDTSVRKSINFHTNNALC